MADINLQEHHEKMYQEMPKDVLEKAVAILKAVLPEPMVEDGKVLYQEFKDQNVGKGTKGDWFTPYHFFTGMQIRNELRQAGLLDEQLPSGNWDDYYVVALEVAIGVREMK